MELLPWLLPLTGLLLAVLLGLAVRAGNLKRERRHLQLPMLLLGLIGTVTAASGSATLTEWARDLLSISLIQQILSALSPGGRLQEVLSLAALLVFNLLILAILAAIKMVLRLLLSRWKGTPPREGAALPLRWIWTLIYFFYERKGERIELQRSWVSVERSLTYALRLLAAAFGLLLVVLHLPILFPNAAWVPATFLQSCADAVYVWPAVTFVLLNELRWYLGGGPEPGKPGQLSANHADMERVVDYQALAEQYRLQFPERFASDFVVGELEGGGELGGGIRTENELDSALIERLIRSGVTPDRGFFTCLQHLVRREDALINAAVFSEFGEYFFQYLNLLLARGENLLFLCADEVAARLVHNGIREKLRELNGFHPVWLIKNRESLHDTLDGDVMVMTPQFILDDNILIGQDHFFRKLSMVVLLGAAELISRDGAVLTLVAKRLNQTMRDSYRRPAPQYVCFSDSIPPETVNAVRQLLDLRGELYVCDGARSRKDTRLMLWNYEAAAESGDDGYYRAQDRLFVNRSETYWGVGIPLACVALKYGVPEICVSASSAPCFQIADSVRHSFSHLTNYFGPEITVADLDDALRFRSFQTIREDAEFLIVEDVLCNIPLTLSRLCRFGGSHVGMIHLISKPYLLRDYFVSNAQRFAASEAGVNMIVPALADIHQATIVRLLCDADGRGADSETVVSLISALDPSAKGDLRRALEVFRDMAFPEKETDGALEDCFEFSRDYVFNEATQEYDRKVYVRLRWKTALRHFQENARSGVARFQGVEEPIGVPACCLRQYFIPSQTIVRNGRLYRVTRIDVEAGLVELGVAANQLNVPVDYVQVRRYKLPEPPRLAERYPVRYRSDGDRCTTGYEILLFNSAHIVVETPGYFALDPVNPKLDLVHGAKFREISAARQAEQRRDYERAVVASFQIKDVGEEAADRTAFLLAVMMNELMKTVFPYTHPCIAVCPVLNDPKALLADPMARSIADAYPQVRVGEGYCHRRQDVEVLMIQDSPNDLGLIRTLLLNEQYPFGAFFDILYEYLKWYQEFRPSGNLSNRYLWFGGEGLPDCFELETLLAICDEFDRMRRSDSIVVDAVGDAGTCSYCHRSIGGISYTRMQDHAGANDRRICARCARMLVRTEKGLAELDRKARRYLCDSFGITLPEDIKLVFASAESIRRKMSTGRERTVLGFADYGARELWVESDAPATNVTDVLVHELTHFWQFENLESVDQELREGHASYVEVQYLRHIRRKELADWKDQELRGRDDPYGRGYRKLSAELEENHETNSFRYLLERYGKAPAEGEA